MERSDCTYGAILNKDVYYYCHNLPRIVYGMALQFFVNCTTDSFISKKNDLNVWK